MVNKDEHNIFSTQLIDDKNQLLLENPVISDITMICLIPLILKLLDSTKFTPPVT